MHVHTKTIDTCTLFPQYNQLFIYQWVKKRLRIGEGKFSETAESGKKKREIEKAREKHNRKDTRKNIFN